MQEKTNVRFLLGARLQDPTADILTFTFQRDIFGEDLHTLQVPRQLRETLGPAAFLDYVADYYLEQQPAEAARIDRAAVLFALTHGWRLPIHASNQNERAIWPARFIFAHHSKCGRSLDLSQSPGVPLGRAHPRIGCRRQLCKSQHQGPN